MGDFCCYKSHVGYGMLRLQNEPRRVDSTRSIYLLHVGLGETYELCHR